MKSLCRFVAMAVTITLAGCMVQPEKPEPVRMAMHCGALTITTQFVNDQLLLDTGQDQLVMETAISASGARFVHPDDPSTSFWNKGNTAQLIIKGQSWPQCVLAGTLAEPFRASGNEPFWTISLEDGQFTLQRMDVAVNLTTPYQQSSEGSDILIALQEQSGITDARVSQAICHDNMSGMPYPYEVSFTLNGETLSGCGGEPQRLVQGEQWLVTSLERTPLAEGSEVTINFLEDNLIAGSGSCNWYSGRYQLSGEGIEIGALVSTKRACAQPLMDQEHQFLEGLVSVSRFDFDKEGRMVLFGNGKLFAVAKKAGY